MAVAMKVAPLLRKVVTLLPRMVWKRSKSRRRTPQRIENENSNHNMDLHPWIIP
jgi:hypothetical protein